MDISEKVVRMEIVDKVKQAHAKALRSKSPRGSEFPQPVSFPAYWDKDGNEFHAPGLFLTAERARIEIQESMTPEVDSTRSQDILVRAFNQMARQERTSNLALIQKMKTELELCEKENLTQLEKLAIRKEKFNAWRANWYKRRAAENKESCDYIDRLQAIQEWDAIQAMLVKHLQQVGVTRHANGRRTAESRGRGKKKK